MGIQILLSPGEGVCIEIGKRWRWEFPVSRSVSQLHGGIYPINPSCQHVGASIKGVRRKTRVIGVSSSLAATEKVLYVVAAGIDGNAAGRYFEIG
jgi:hypothetical protein